MIRKAGTAALFLMAASTAAQAGPLTITHLSQVATTGGSASAEIPAFDATSKRLFVVNGAAKRVDVWDLSNPASPVLVPGGIDISALGTVPNSVAAQNGMVAVAIEAATKTNPGVVALYNASTLALLSSAPTGALPDMVSFTPNGRYVLTANEGEPSSDYSIDPEGSVTIVDIKTPTSPVVRQVGFTAFNSEAATLKAQGVRLFGLNATVAQDLEPEYITAQNTKAYVTLQENNAIAEIDLKKGVATRIMPLGYKDHSLAANALDASDRDNAAGNGAAINITSRPLRGLYLPDAIAHYKADDGNVYLVTANEGDAREYTGLVEEARISTLTLDPVAFPNAATLKGNGPDGIGRLNVTRTMGDVDNDGDYDALYSFGARSISVFSTNGTLVGDTGSSIETETARLAPAYFNSEGTTATLDGRSDNKGPEPEGVDIGKIGGVPYAFVGLERIGGVIVYDLSVPSAPTFVDYVNPNFGLGAPTLASLAPEGVHFVKPKDGPQGKALLLVSNESSGTTDIYQVTKTK